MKITESVLLQFRQEDKTKFAQESTNATRFINSLDISSNGESMISSADDEFIYVYDLLSGPSPERGLRSKRYGADIIRYTNASNTAIHSSTRVNDAIRYYSIHDNKYIRFFEGHDKKVVMLSMSPVDDTFLSGSLDETIRMWDLRHPVCVGLMRMNGRPVGNYDPEGLIFAAGIGSDTIKLYDLRSFEKGPFSSFNIPKDPIEYSSNIEWTSLKFSLDGKYILLSTNGSLIKLIDSFSGSVVQTFSGYLNAKNQPLEASFTPDAQFVLSGSSDGKIHIWDVDKGRKVGALQSDHFEPIHSVQFNPKFMMFATACQQIDFWRPPNDKP